MAISTSLANPAKEPRSRSRSPKHADPLNYPAKNQLPRPVSSLFEPWVRTRICSRYGGGQAGQEVVPAGGVHAQLAVRKIPVNEPQTGAASGRRKRELDRGRTRRHVGAASDTPADHDPVRRLDLQVLPPDRDTVDVDGECTTRLRLESGVLAHPADHGGRIGQVPEHLLDGSRQLHVSLEHLAH